MGELGQWQQLACLPASMPHFHKLMTHCSSGRGAHALASELCSLVLSRLAAPESQRQSPVTCCIMCVVVHELTNLSVIHMSLLEVVRGGEADLVPTAIQILAAHQHNMALCSATEGIYLKL